ncbi:Kunitz/Bovine pancreatic trypsin inhibitor domain protein [Ancylostoma caninum]|uniref:Kunitz/Bovine pancreatic trypsin inhibitor domain protein n=1 Tax=Ancylostoma caninum TaxID=29170 RepID=A0A368FZ02_ANCCA|nr:Kunitz/Bovine pancreatic trypsin inhibitor domain protein [Ancylostoma caninum]
MLSLVAVLALASGVYAAVDPCDLPLESGPCRGSIPRYGFDKTRGKCVQFNYGGCKGNKNNFLTLENCKKECNGEGILDKVATISKKYAEKRKLTKEVKEAFARAETRQEKKKLKDAIEKNVADAIKKTINEEKVRRNIKDTKNKVEKVIEKIKELKEEKSNPCMMPISSGPCKALMKRFAFDAKRGKCVEFPYGGCGGNKNNFKSKAECLKTCIANIPMPI